MDRNRTFRPARTIDRGRPYGTGVLRCIDRSVARHWTVLTHTRYRRTVGCMGHFTGETGITSSDSRCGHGATDDREASGFAHTRLSAYFRDIGRRILVGAIQRAKAVFARSDSQHGGHRR